MTGNSLDKYMPGKDEEEVENQEPTNEENEEVEEETERYEDRIIDAITGSTDEG